MKTAVMPLIKNEKYNNLVAKAIEIYVMVVTSLYFFFLIAPVRNLIRNTFLYRFQAYFGIFGFFLIIMDFLGKRIILKGKYEVLLIIILVSSGISSLLMMRYGIKDNLFSIGWTTIYFSLFYTLSLRMKTKEFDNKFTKMMNVLSYLWFVLCLVSSLFFIFNIGYLMVTNPYDNGGLTRQGFLENRLFGIFMSINVSAEVSSIFLIYSVFKFIKNKKLRFLVLAFGFLLHVLLTGSRSSMFGLELLIFFSSGIFFFFKMNKRKYKINKIILSLLCAVFIVGIFTLSINVIKKAISNVPILFETEENRTWENKILKQNPDILIKDKLSNKTDSNATMESENILEREDTQNGNISNNRFKIWLDYFQRYRDIGIFGLSPNNYSYYLAENYPEIYIVKHIKEFYPDLYRSGSIYHPHNGFLYIYVSSGLVGIVSLIVYLFLFVLDIIKKILFDKQTDEWLIYSYLLILMFCLINIMFDTGLIFNSDFVSCVFWVLIGRVTIWASNKDNANTDLLHVEK